MELYERIASRSQTGTIGVHQQARQLRKKYGKGNVEVRVSNLGETTTGEAKRIENSILKKIFKRTGKVPPGNIKSFKPKSKK